MIREAPLKGVLLYMSLALFVFSGLMTIILVTYIVKPNNLRFKRHAQIYALLFFGVFSILLVDKTDWALVAAKINSIQKQAEPAIETPTKKIEPIEAVVASAEVSATPLKDSVLLDAPIIAQYPELPRGCEITSLAMLLQYAGVEVDKMTLAKEIKKDPTPYKKVNGKITFGHPNIGFVGDMYTKKNKGYGVYHRPVADLASQFLPARIIDITGSDFDAVKMYLSNDTPVWVITNVKYKKLPKHYFETWHTSEGVIDITYQEHSVLVTGYDEKYIYFNDPLTGKKNKKAPKEDFIKSWEQMGKQAITYLY
ncbi:C39 family peptidase [Litchfieldia alkalitelluris]|uniref:C39 family peptidase n=1 Tax=Litchfieldia alkalitelluris TaxID=304268 RepID=UPI001F3B7028|nr:C39 family peptidase [Litchfieldia alkalitelluris]